METKLVRLAEILNNVYVEKLDKLRAKMAKPSDPILHYCNMIPTHRDKLEFLLITPAETRLLLTKMRLTKSTGRDGISMMTLCQNLDILSAPIANIINITITTDTLCTRRAKTPCNLTHIGL